MNADDLRNYYMKALIIWIDDRQNLPMAPKYLESHSIAVVDSIEYAKLICDRLHMLERKKQGRAITRYRISGHENGKNMEYVVTEDLEKTQLDEMLGIIPEPPKR